MEKIIEKEMSKERQNELALQNATTGKGYILYDPETPLVINSETKILKIYNKDIEEEIPLDYEEQEEIEEMELNQDLYEAEESEQDDVDVDEGFSLDEMINREFNHYDNSLEDDERTSFDEHKYREVRIVFADKTSNPQASTKVKYSTDIFTELTLEELQEKLLECNSEEDIEEIQE